MGCIYLHRLILDCQSKGKGYVGKAIKDPKYRWNHGKGYLSTNTLFKHAILKYGGIEAWDTSWEHIILEDNVPDELLSEREIYWIARLHTFIGDPKCNGYNMTPGGEGGATTGLPILMIEPITLRVINEFVSASEAARYVNGLTGAISAACLGKLLTAYDYHWCYKKDWSSTWQPRQKIIPGAREIYQIDANSLKVVNIFKTIVEAANYAEVSTGVIKNCANKQHTAIDGYYYLYANKYTSNWQPIIKQANRHGMKAVLCFETNKEYDSFASAGRVYHTTATNIFNCCHNYNYTLKGNHFCLVEDREKLAAYLKEKAKKEDDNHIICFETKQEYLSITEVANITGINKSQISQCCHGKALTAGPNHYHWCYKKDYKNDIIWQQQKIYEGKCKAVRCIETGIIYKSTAEAFRQTGIRHIVECCKDPHKKAGGYHWEYVDKEK